MIVRELVAPNLLFVHRLGKIRGALHCKATVIDSRHLYEFLDWQGGPAWALRGPPERARIGFSGCETTEDYWFLKETPIYADPPWQQARTGAEKRCLLVLESSIPLTLTGVPSDAVLPFFLCSGEPGPAYAASLVVRLEASALIDFPDVRAAMVFDKVYDMDDRLPGPDAGTAEFEEAARQLCPPIGCPMSVEIRGGCAALQGVLRLDEQVGANQFKATFVFMDLSSGVVRLCKGANLERRVTVPRFVARSKEYFKKDQFIEGRIAEVLEIEQVTPLDSFIGW